MKQLKDNGIKEIIKLVKNELKGYSKTNHTHDHLTNNSGGLQFSIKTGYSKLSHIMGNSNYKSIINSAYTNSYQCKINVGSSSRGNPNFNNGLPFSTVVSCKYCDDCSLFLDNLCINDVEGKILLSTNTIGIILPNRKNSITYFPLDHTKSFLLNILFIPNLIYSMSASDNLIITTNGITYNNVSIIGNTKDYILYL